MQVLHVTLNGISKDVLSFSHQFSSLPDLQRLHLGVNSRAVPWENNLLDYGLRGMVRMALPKKLLEFHLEDTANQIVASLPLGLISERLPHLETLSLRRILCGREEGVKLPPNLTSLTLPSVENLLAVNPNLLWNRI